MEPPGATYKRPPHSAWPTQLEAISLRHRLIGRKLPTGFTIQSTDERQLRLAGPTAALVVYVFPGSATSPAHGPDTPLADAEEHRSFRDLNERLTRMGLIVVGVSSQPAVKLQEAIAANRLPQPLASDATRRVGELLNLPTFRAGAEPAYERLTILIIAGQITQVFYPVPTPGRHAEEVLAHFISRQ